MFVDANHFDHEGRILRCWTISAASAASATSARRGWGVF
jgi:hypothetical protein